MKNIFVANLSYQVSSDDLKQAFEEYGEVSSAKVIYDKETGRSRGFGFVEMPNDDQAAKAIEELNQAEFDNKVISVSEAKPRPPKSGGFGGGGGYKRREGGSGGGSGYNKFKKPNNNYNQ